MTKKQIVLIASIGLILILGGTWVYALLHPSAGGEGIFAQFGMGGDAIYVPLEEADFIDGTEEEMHNEPDERRLRQLTTNPVAGAAFVQNGIFYIEQGTGHLKYIDLVSGEETLVSGTTIPGAYDASFSIDGEAVTITTTLDGSAKTIIAAVPDASSTGNITGVSLPLGATEVNMTEKPGTVYYLLRSDAGARGYAYSISKRTSVELFAIPLRDVHVLWGEPIYVYTTPTNAQTGYVYRLAGSDLRYMGEGGVGLMAFRYKNDAVVTKQYVADTGTSVWLSVLNDAVLGGPVIPEKCVTGPGEILCAIPQKIDSNFPDSWYKGAVSYSDSLWSIDPTDATAYVLSDFLEESGRQIDVLKIGIDSFGTYLYLINKNDNTLWLYQL